MYWSSTFVFGMYDAPGADGCIIDSSLKEGFVKESGCWRSADNVGVYDDIT
jgi:hypothetical protein